MLTINAQNEWQQQLLQNIANELDISLVNDDTLNLSDEQVYQIETERLKQFNIPESFTGTMAVSVAVIGHNPLSCSYRVKFKLNDKILHEGLPKDCHLNDDFLLSKEMYDLSQMIDQAQENNNEDFHWRAIEFGTNQCSEQIKFSAFPIKDVLCYSNQISVDLKPTENGKYQLLAHINNISDEFYNRKS